METVAALFIIAAGLWAAAILGGLCLAFMMKFPPLIGELKAGVYTFMVVATTIIGLLAVTAAVSPTAAAAISGQLQLWGLVLALALWPSMLWGVHSRWPRWDWEGTDNTRKACRLAAVMPLLATAVLLARGNGGETLLFWAFMLAQMGLFLETLFLVAKSYKERKVYNPPPLGNRRDPNL